MQMNDMILVSVDDHIIEPKDMFQKHLSKEHLALAPRNVRTDDNRDVWVFEDKVVNNVGLNSVVGRPKEEYGFEPVAYDQMREGGYILQKRVDDMNVNGVLGSINFATFPSFCGQLFWGAKDKANAARVVRAYNDWHIDEWCGNAPGRFIPNALLPLWDIDLTVEEIKRVVKKGCRSIAFPDNPCASGLPSIHNKVWDKVWGLCADEEIMLNCHIGTGFAPPHASMESPIDAWITTMPISIANAAGDWLTADIWQRFPKLKVALSEGGIGWIPYFLERADFTYMHHGTWTHANYGGKKPSEVFREHIITCFIDDKFGLRNRHEIGVDMITWECDYPHSDCTWPNAPEFLWESIKDLPDDEINKITHENVMRMWHYDPFSVLGRENCTVGALRELAREVDTKPVSKPGINPNKKGAGHRVTSGDILPMFA